MAKRKYRILRIGSWTLLGLFSLVILVTMTIYLGREYFMGKAVEYLNQQQPGEVKMEQINLIPFLNFPDVTLQLSEVNFYEEASYAKSSKQEPILSFGEIHITLDVVELIRGSIMVSEARLENGMVDLLIYEDSVINIEKALGIRFGKQTDQEEADKPSINVDLDKIELVNISCRMDNLLRDEELSFDVNELRSSFSYLDGLIRAAIEVNVDVFKVKYQAINNEIDKNVIINSRIILNPEARLIDVEPSSLSVSGLDFETWGSFDYRELPRVDFAYRASNEGLELLNFLLKGILDMDEIEQIGGGSIHLNGTVQGAIGGGELPVVRVNGDADDLGFRIKSLDKDVTGITFQMFATNGSKTDLSEGHLDLKGFKAHFPDGDINANITASNIREPKLNIEVYSEVQLESIEEIVEIEFLSDLEGTLVLNGRLGGNVNRKKGTFLHDEGSLTASLEDISFVVNHDSIKKDSISDILGKIVLDGNLLGTDNMKLTFNGNSLEIGLTTENLLLYLFNYDTEIKADIRLSSDLIIPETIIRDTAITNILGDEIKALRFIAGAKINREELDDFLEQDSIPGMEIYIDSFAVSLPLYADISDIHSKISIGPDTISVHQMGGTIGESSFNFSGVLSNYESLLQPDSGGLLKLDFNISSDLMKAEDLFTMNHEFLLPQNYKTEYLDDFRISGSFEAPAAGLIYDSLDMDFALDILDLGFGFRYYPSRFEDFLIQLERSGDMLLIQNVQGSVGENNLNLTASLGNFSDTLAENIYGSIELYSDLLDFNQLLNYNQPRDDKKIQEADTVEQGSVLQLNEMAYPNIDFIVDIGELRYDKHRIYGMNGKFRTSRDKIFYLDKLVTSPEGKGTLELNGQLNVSNPDMYALSAELDLEGIDISDLNLNLQSGDTVMALKDHFQGIIDAKGLAEIFISPELKVDVPTSTAAFNVTVNDGALINFTPLQAAGKYLDSKDLNHVRFATVRNSFTMMDSRIHIPLMNVESTVGQLLIEGEQGLDKSYLYLVRVPPKLAREAARSAMSEGEKDDGEDKLNQMKRGDFMRITVWSNGIDSDFKLGDKRDKFQE